MQVLDRDEYLGLHGCSDAASGYCLDKLRSNRTVRTAHGRKRFEKECAEAETKYQAKRNACIEEYERLVASGEVRPRTHIERMIRKAQGHPDNPSVQAARRMCEKRGIDWKVGA